MGKNVEEQDDDEPAVKRVRVPVRREPGPFGHVEYAKVPENTAAHWSDRVWHDKPPR
jgi:hypothetical protein